MTPCRFIVCAWPVCIVIGHIILRPFLPDAPSTCRTSCIGLAVPTQDVCAAREFSVEWYIAMYCRDDMTCNFTIRCLMVHSCIVDDRGFRSIKNSSLWNRLYVLTKTDGCCGVRFYLRLSVCLLFRTFVSKTDAARIMKLGREMFHDESWKPNYFGLKRLIRSQGHESTNTLLSRVFAHFWVLAFLVTCMLRRHGATYGDNWGGFLPFVGIGVNWRKWEEASLTHG